MIGSVETTWASLTSRSKISLQKARSSSRWVALSAGLIVLSTKLTTVPAKLVQAQVEAQAWEEEGE